MNTDMLNEKMADIADTLNDELNLDPDLEESLSREIAEETESGVEESNPFTLVRRARDHMQRTLDNLTAQKQAVERKVAGIESRLEERNRAATAAFEAEQAAAHAEWTSAMASAQGELAQITVCREAIDLAVGRLNKA